MSPEPAQMDLLPFISILLRMAGGLDPQYYRQKFAFHCQHQHCAMGCEYVVCSSTRPHRLTVVIHRRQFLLLWSPLHDVISKFRGLTHGASSSTFLVVIAIVVVVAIAQCDVNALGARSEDIVIDVCCCQCRN